jgi:hypothetical protein
MTEAVLVMAALLLRMPNMLLLARTVASFACSCECPDTYVKAPSPTKVALPVGKEKSVTVLSDRHMSSEACIPTTRHGVQSSNSALSCFSASLNVGGVISCDMVTANFSSYIELRNEKVKSYSKGGKAAGAGTPPVNAHGGQFTAGPPAKTCPTNCNPTSTLSAWRADASREIMSTIEALYIFDEHKYVCA